MFACKKKKKKKKSRRMCDKRNERKKEEAARMYYDEDGAGGWNSRDSGPTLAWGGLQRKAGKCLMDRIMQDNIWVRPCVTKSLFIGSPGGLPERGYLKRKYKYKKKRKGGEKKEKMGD